MRIRWTVPAADDLQNIKNYLQQHYPQFAEPTVRTIYQHIRSLKASPNRGRPGHRSDTKELALLSRDLRQEQEGGISRFPFNMSADLHCYGDVMEGRNDHLKRLDPWHSID
jgi:plasmid stabilization system protein ParE